VAVCLACDVGGVTTDACASGLRSEQVLAAFRVLLSALDLVQACDDAPSPGSWQVHIGQSSREFLTLRVTDSAGEGLVQARVATRRRRPADLARTLALLVTETLLPYVPLGADAMASKLDVPEAPPQVEAPPRDEPEREDAAWLLLLGVQSGARWVLPKRQWLAGLGVSGGATYGGLQVGLSVFRWTSTATTGPGYHLRGESSTVQLPLGLAWELGSLRLSVEMGAEARLYSLVASGERARFHRRDYWNFGPMGHMGVGGSWRGWVATLNLEGVRYLNRHPIGTVDDEPVLNSGRAAVGLDVAISYSL